MLKTSLNNASARTSRFRRFISVWHLPLWQWALLLLFCASVGAILTTVFYWQTYATYVTRGRDTSLIRFAEFFPGEITRRIAWLLLLPTALHTIRAFRIVPQDGLKSVFRGFLLHSAFSFAFAVVSGVLTVMLCYLIAPLFHGENYVIKPLQEFFTYMTFVSGVVASLVVYWLFLVGSHALEYAFAYRTQTERAAELEKQLAKAQLQALQMQLQPHFLFNALNSISSLLYEDIRRADSMITRLGDFLRLTLTAQTAQKITLDEECDFLRRYLAIEEMRFEEHLRVVWEIDFAAKQALVPSFLLQPLVENALKHGIMRSAQGGEIRLTAQIQDESNLYLAVENEIPSQIFTPEIDIKRGTTSLLDCYHNNGIGLQNTQERLAHLYGEKATLHYGIKQVGVLPLPRYIVQIRLPLEQSTKTAKTLPTTTEEALNL